MKLLVFSCCVLLIGLVTKISSVPHHGHDHGDHKHNLTEHKHEHKHSNHTHNLTGTVHLAGNEHNETMTQHDDHMNICHQELKLVDCSESVKGTWIFKHTNSTHHECVQIENGKCSSSSNAFETEQLCEKTCHHDDHKMGSKIV